MNQPAVEVADLLRAQGSRFLGHINPASAIKS